MKWTAGKRHLVSRHTAYKNETMPRVDMLEMIEDTVRRNRYFESKTKLWKALPREVPHVTLDTALSYLERSNKITQNRDGSLVWIYVDNELALESLEASSEL